MIIKLIPPLEEQRGSGDPQLRVDKATTIFSAYLETMLSLPYGRHQRANKTLISFYFLLLSQTLKPQQAEILSQ